jgi:alkylation response protein AidB-like acyl-CoA dehydrogenase
MTEQPDPYIDKAAALAPLLIEQGDAARRLGRLTDDVVDALGAAGLITLMAPRNRGGAQASLATFVRVQEELARGCGSTSWVCGIYTAALYVLSFFPDEAQDEVFTDPAPKSAFAFQPEGSATQVAGGYRLSGTWRFCSGQHHADWALLASIALLDGKPPMPAQFLVPRADWTSADDWQVFGLSGTGSSSITVNDAFVPEHRVMPMADPAKVVSRSRTLADDPYFRMPAIPFAVTAAIGTPLGLARAALEHFLDRVQRRGISYTKYARQAEAPITHLQADTASMKLDHARFHAERSVQTVAKVVEDPGNVALRVRCRADAAWATKLCWEVVETVRQGAGASAIRHQDHLSRIVTDIEALSVHSLLLHSTNSELHGRVLCGLAPEVQFI